MEENGVEDCKDCLLSLPALYCKLKHMTPETCLLIITQNSQGEEHHYHRFNIQHHHHHPHPRHHPHHPHHDNSDLAFILAAQDPRCKPGSGHHLSPQSESESKSSANLEALF